MTKESRIRKTIVHHKAKAREECGDKACTHRLYSASRYFNGLSNGVMLKLAVQGLKSVGLRKGC